MTKDNKEPKESKVEVKNDKSDGRNKINKNPETGVAGGPKRWGPWALAMPEDQNFKQIETKAPIYIKNRDQSNAELNINDATTLADGWWQLYIHRGREEQKYNNAHRYVFTKHIKVVGQKVTLTDTTDVTVNDVINTNRIFNLILKDVPYIIKNKQGHVLLSNAVERNYAAFLDRALGAKLLSKYEEIMGDADSKRLANLYGIGTFLINIIDEYLRNNTDDEKYITIVITLIAIGADFVDKYIAQVQSSFRSVDLNKFEELKEEKLIPWKAQYDTILSLLQKKEE